VRVLGELTTMIATVTELKVQEQATVGADIWGGKYKMYESIYPDGYYYGCWYVLSRLSECCCDHGQMDEHATTTD